MKIDCSHPLDKIRIKRNGTFDIPYCSSCGFEGTPISDKAVAVISLQADAWEDFCEKYHVRCPHPEEKVHYTTLPGLEKISATCACGVWGDGTDTELLARYALLSRAWRILPLIESREVFCSTKLPSGSKDSCR